MRQLNIGHKVILFILLAVFAACNPTRRLSKDQYLLSKNKVEVSTKEIDIEEVESFIKQKPNRKIIGLFRFHLGIYNLADRMDDKKEKKDRKTDKWKQRRLSKGRVINPKKEKRKREPSLKMYFQEIGEPPVIVDTSLTSKSAKQIKYYLNSKGYFNSKVTKSYRQPRLLKKRKQIAIYNILARKPYKIRNIKYLIRDTTIEDYVNGFKDNSLLIQ
ncbi:hypothetical protein ACFLQ5_01775, partial [Bacteroidota bacterium]